MIKIEITLNDENQVLASTNAPVGLEQFTNMLQTAQLNYMNAVLSHVPPNEQQGMKEMLFQLYNEAASNTLAAFAPDIDMRPDLTEVAIMEMETKVMDKTMRENLNRADRRRFGIK